MYGAGNIGRGFIAQLFSKSGYDVALIDVNRAVIDKLNEDKYLASLIKEKLTADEIKLLDQRIGLVKHLSDVWYR